MCMILFPLSVKQTELISYEDEGTYKYDLQPTEELILLLTVRNSMRKRCQAVIDANGGHTRYSCFYFENKFVS